MVESSVSRVAIKIQVDNSGDAEGEFIRHLAPRTVEAFLKKMPLEGRTAVWKEQVYFEVPVKIGEEKPTTQVKKGTITYWPMGSALCIFFGDSQPYSPVNVVGQVTKNLELFESVRSGVRIRVQLL